MPATILFTDAGPEPSHTIGQMLAATKVNATQLRNTLLTFMQVQGFDYAAVIWYLGYPTVETYTRGSEVQTVYTGLSNFGSPYDLPLYTYAYPPGYIGGDVVDVLNYSFNSDGLLINTSWTTI